MVITVTVSSDLDIAPAYEFDFVINVIDCAQEVMTITDPGTCPISGSF